MKRMNFLLLLLILLAIFIIFQQGIIAKTLYAIKDAQGNMIGVTDMNSLPGDMVEQGCTLEYLSGDKPKVEPSPEIGGRVSLSPEEIKSRMRRAIAGV